MIHSIQENSQISHIREANSYVNLDSSIHLFAIPILLAVGATLSTATSSLLTLSGIWIAIFGLSLLCIYFSCMTSNQESTPNSVIQNQPETNINTTEDVDPISQLSEEDWNNPEVMKRFSGNVLVQHFDRLGENCKNNLLMMQSVIKNKPALYSRIGESLKTDIIFAMFTLTEDPMQLEHMSENFRKQEVLVLKAIDGDLSARQFADLTLNDAIERHLLPRQHEDIDLFSSDDEE